MSPERIPIPEIPSQQIDPELHLDPEVRARHEAKREQEMSLSRILLKWYKGDAHTHSQASTRAEYGHVEAVYTRPEILKYYEKLGLEFVAFTEHTSNPGQPEVLTIEDAVAQSLLREVQEVTALNREHRSEVLALSGVEANILFDTDGQPRVDVPDDVLEQLDVVIGSRHAIANEKEPAAIKTSLLMAAQHPLIDVMGHPDRYTRKSGEQTESYWQEYWAIWPDILQAMKENHKAFELNLNSMPDKRLVTMAAEAGLPFFLNFDAHDFHHFKWEQSTDEAAGKAATEKWGRGESTEEDLPILAEYKADRLSHGPGTRALLRLARWTAFLTELGVTPERVVNSSKENLLNFLQKHRGKHTENLDQIGESSE